MSSTAIWVFRTYEARRDWVWKEIRAGRLRQGWGCEGAALAENGSPLRCEEWIRRYSEGVRKHWKFGGEAYIQEAETRHGILSPMLEMAAGDLVLVPHMPEDAAFTLLRVAGPYRFDQALLEEEGHSDLGHIIPVESRLVVSRDSCPEAARIASDLRRWRKAVNRVRKPEMEILIQEVERLATV